MLNLRSHVSDVWYGATIRLLYYVSSILNSASHGAVIVFSFFYVHPLQTAAQNLYGILQTEKRSLFLG